ncbi:rod shape-determining protein [Candidatus Babeliales bacterium]|nr:rod shape-determining protein [Candidatus Babeliales bacterium]
MKFLPAVLTRYFSNDLGIDLGTANTIIYVKNRGIVLDQPSVVAIKTSTHEVLAAGDRAKDMLGKTPESIIACRPMRDGVIANYQLTESMLRFFIKEVHNNRTTLVRPRMIVGVPSGITQVEKRAIEDSAKQAGAREVHTIMEPMAAAIGAGLNVEDPTGNMIVDIGGGTTEVAIISLKDVVYCKSVRMGGDEMDRAIVQYVKRKYNLLIGERTAEVIKINIGTAMLGSEVQEATIKGRDLMTGLPKTLTLTDAEVFEALTEPIAIIIDAVRSALENTPPELSSDLAERGITLAGGTSQLKNLTTLLEAETKLPVRLADDPLRCVITGIGKVLDNLDFFRDALMR